MKLITIVEKLKDNMDIKYTVRKDGGIIITSINGQKFRNKEGNTRLRELTGQPLSAKVITQRVQANEAKRIINTTLSKKGVKQEYQQTKARLKAIGKSKYLKARSFKQRIEQKGLEGALDSLRNIERKAMGYAYDGNVLALIDRLESITDDNGKLTRIKNYLRMNLDKVKDRQLMEVYHAIYYASGGYEDTDQLVFKIERILNI